MLTLIKDKILKNTIMFFHRLVQFRQNCEKLYFLRLQRHLLENKKNVSNKIYVFFCGESESAIKNRGSRLKFASCPTPRGVEVAGRDWYHPIGPSETNKFYSKHFLIRFLVFKIFSCLKIKKITRYNSKHHTLHCFSTVAKLGGGIA